MSTSGMSTDLFVQFSDEGEIVEYYARRFSRPQINRYAELSGVDIQGKRVEADVRKLFEQEALERFHEYNAKLYRIGSDTIIEGIQKIDRSKLENLSEEEMDSKTTLILYLIEWDWSKEIDLIRALKDFKKKRTYERRVVEGERAFEELTDEVVKEIESAIRDTLPKLNNVQRYKSDLNSIDQIEGRTLIVRFYTESRSGSYKQFKFREEKLAEFPGEGDVEVASHSFWPLKTEHVYIDYGRNEYYADVKRNQAGFVKPILETLYNSPTFGDRVKFVDPLDFKSQTPEEFVKARVEDQREAIEDAKLLTAEKKGDYNRVLDDLEAAEQTRIRLEHVNVEGDLESFEIGTEEDISEFLGAHDLAERVEEFNEKSQDREFTIRIGDRDIDISGTSIQITGDVTEDEEHIITSLFRRDGAIV